MPPIDFNNSVFINCPFDTEYKPLQQALIFTILYCGLIPRIASESGDAGEVRISKILALMRRSKYSVHDLSRIEPIGADDLPRFNMPFELGIDWGLKGGMLRDKRFLVFEKERYRYQKFLSDIAGNDIKGHDSNPENIVRRTRDWLRQNAAQALPPGRKIWEDYNIFLAHFQEALVEAGHDAADIASMPINEYMDYIREWLDAINTP